MSIIRDDRFLSPDEAQELARALATIEAAADRVCEKLNGRAKAAWLDRVLPLSASRRMWFVLRSGLAQEWGEREGNPFEGEAWTRLRRAADEVL